MNTSLRRLLPWLLYPGVIVLALALHVAIKREDRLFVASYLPVLLAAGAITVLEHILPHRRAWRPEKEEVRTDLGFMLLSQLAVPQLLAFAAVHALAQPLRAAELLPRDFWPHTWPVWVQAVMVLLIADFLRYWLHRAAHHHPLLWQLHAVHHSPQRLYWLNVGRFHPIEKSLQFLFDSLPFLLLGVAEEVIALYFVFYAVNGFFQHCNIRLRHGLLNHVVSSAELHRWHHSSNVREADTNFGNNVILWDALFGTRYLPRGRAVRDLGLRNRHYPKQLADLMRAPFTSGLANEAVRLLGWREVFQRWGVDLMRRVLEWRYWRPLYRAATQPLPAQERVLRDILRTNCDTAYGREYGFSEIRSIAEFRERVPVNTFDSLRPYIERQLHDRTPELTAAMPLRYAQTSGTTGAPKIIPVTELSLRHCRVEQRLLSAYQMRVRPDAFAGKALGIVSPAVEGYLLPGVPCGAVSGHIYEAQPWLVRRRYVVPAPVFSLDDYALKYRLIARLAIAEHDITYLGTANPSTFVQLLEVLNARRTELFESLVSGGFPEIDRLPSTVRRAVMPRLRAMPARAEELRRLPANRDLTYADLWPSIRMLTTWSGGSCGIALARLRQTLPSDTTVIELGYVSSEFRGTISIDPETNAGMPMLTHHFLEFVAREEWERGGREFLTLDQLSEERDYYVIVTTAGGLYRYFMNDIVRVTGFEGRTPLLKFLQKGRGVTSITGEKLYESQVLEAMEDVCSKLGIAPLFYVLVADEQTASYGLFVECSGSHALPCAVLADALDSRLGKLNLEYRAKRASGRLHPVSAHRLKEGTLAAYKRHCVYARHQREGQFKPAALQYRRDLEIPLEDFVEMEDVKS